MQLKQQFDSWVIITEANPFEFAEMFGNIGGFWGESHSISATRILRHAYLVKTTIEQRFFRGFAVVGATLHVCLEDRKLYT